jgi:hypothetical protein
MNTTIQTSLVAACLLVGAAGCGAAEDVDENLGSQSEALVGNVSLGSYYDGKFYLDHNNDGVFNGDIILPVGADAFGGISDMPVIGYGAGHTCGQATFTMGVFRPSTGEYFFDTNGNFMWDSGDRSMAFASPFVNYNPIPFIWTRKVGSTCQGLAGVTFFSGDDLVWLIDGNDNGIFDGGASEVLGVFGTDNVNYWPSPIWSVAKNSSVIAVFDRFNGDWYVDTNNNKAFDGCATDSCTNFGQIGDVPFGNSASTKRGVTRLSTAKYIDGNGTGWWEGAPGDAGYSWRPFDTYAFIWAG